MAVTWKKIAFYDEVATNFLGLSDTPGSFVLAGAYYKVNAGLTAVEEGLVAGAASGLATLDASSVCAQDPKAHLLGAHTTDTLANLNSIVTDATLIDTTDPIMEADLVAKGDLVSASVAGTHAILTAGTNGKLLKTLSTEASGLVWDDLALDDCTDPDAAVGMAGQQLTDHVIHTVADATARDLLTAVVGKMCWQTDELHPFVCTIAV